MTPYPMDPVDATGPMRLVGTALPDTPASDGLVRSVLEARLAACAQVVAARSTYWWKEALETAAERVVWFKTSPKHVGALFRFLTEHHPYEVPEIIEIDVARVHGPYLEYLAATLDPNAPPPPLGGGTAARRPTRREGPRGRGARRPGRTPAPRHRR
ncbi:MAG TPA: divalent-cation tolerance protein CutA [Thermoplasmata archaeon]|nr:divalent-cation tolerance protein CutA [Thermoplasmata archaeon]